MSLLGQDGGRHPAHMETLTMSRKERNRMTIMAGVKGKELTQVQAAELMGLGYRQAKRIWRRYQDEGDAGLLHPLRGQAGLRGKAAPPRAAVAAQGARRASASAGALRRGSLCGLRPDAAGRGTGEGGNQGGSRHGAAKAT